MNDKEKILSLDQISDSDREHLNQVDIDEVWRDSYFCKLKIMGFEYDSDSNEVLVRYAYLSYPNTA